MLENRSRGELNHCSTMKKPVQEWEGQTPTSIPRKSAMPDPARAPFLLAGFPTARADRTYRDGSRSVCRMRHRSEPRDAIATAQEAVCRPGRPAAWRGESGGGGAFESEAAAGLRRGPLEGRGRARGRGGRPESGGRRRRRERETQGLGLR